ncbi:MAG: zinc ribbon domain-containing protein [Chloroflexota bacterium]
MNKVNWTSVAVFGIIALLVFLIGTSLLGGWRYGGWGMMGSGMMGGWGIAPFGWIGMLFMWLVPIGFLVLTVVGIAWLVRTIGAGGSTAAPSRNCPSCGRGVRTDWKNCPYCGTSLE